jgi:hypothetical protein
MKKYKQPFFAFIFSALLLLQNAAIAAGEGSPQPDADYQNPFSDYVPFEDEYDIDEDERFMYFGRFFAVGLGSGMHVFSGNIGKLYNTALPVLDFRLLYFFDFRLAGQVGMNSANHAFTAEPSGYVEVNLFRLNLDLKYYLDTKSYGAALTTMNPYLIAGYSQVYRTQVFQTANSVQKDNNSALSGGLGFEFALKPRKSSIGVEGRYHQIFFKDRYDQLYLPSGLPDTTGAMYSLTTSVLFFF